MLLMLTLIQNVVAICTSTKNYIAIIFVSFNLNQNTPGVKKVAAKN